MIKILLATPEKELFSEFASVLGKYDDVELSWAATKAKNRASKSPDSEVLEVALITGSEIPKGMAIS